MHRKALLRGHCLSFQRQIQLSEFMSEWKPYCALKLLRDITFSSSEHSPGPRPGLAPRLDRTRPRSWQGHCHTGSKSRFLTRWKSWEMSQWVKAGLLSLNYYHLLFWGHWQRSRCHEDSRKLARTARGSPAKRGKIFFFLVWRTWHLPSCFVAQIELFA